MRKLVLWPLVYGERARESVLGFLRGERGVVTVEWVALAAGLTIGAIYVSYIVMSGLVTPAHHIASELTP
jgi:hypothetical protein